ncbi:MAG: hypothetical protein A2086_12015 [Spirochaetes bacterium GWD1_27_9]|nr:MAG: hypothetical protein A2Z98_02965 [Spirochaetes bacterium GWB1_27_13]OHD22114.1 MAG: hypothetical protein A2Y34_13485 [Spirochaetes bacterium GWC1_27_15]OHD28959.1 MAG: hypothetical protein A2086_12015 [Spirochaetes bacterium GWD1_27_9]
MKTKFLISIIFLNIIFNGFAASINVDELSIIADSYFITDKNTKFQMNTYFKFVTSFDGGYKFAAKVAFETNTKLLQQNFVTNQFNIGNIYLFFNKAEVTIKNLANSHLSFSFWTGTYKYLGDGNKYRGFLYYPDTPNVDYQGFYRLRGTGLTTQIKFWEDRFRAEFHIYNNSNFISLDPTAYNFFSIDSEVGLYFKNVNFEIFGGYTKDLVIPIEDSTNDMINGRGKVGTSFWVGNEYIDFFTCFGISNLDVNSTNINFNSFYLLGELHFKLFVTDNTISFMTRPTLYNELNKIKRGDSYDFDLNYKLNITVKDFPLSGGLLFNLKYSLASSTNWSLALSPFLSITTFGVVWNLNIHYDFAAIQREKYLDGLRIVLGVSSQF